MNGVRRIAAGITLWAGAAFAEVVTFDDANLGGTNYWNGSDGSGAFVSRGVRFQNGYNAAWGNWWGFSVSRVNAPATAGYRNQYAVFYPGTDVSGSGAYAVFYQDTFAGDLKGVEFPEPVMVRGFYLNNTAYAGQSMVQGDFFAKKFGGATGADPDWFQLTIVGRDGHSNLLGAVTADLANYRSPLGEIDGVVSNWTWVDLTALGPEVRFLHFYMSSSDTGAWGMNTPSYFAMDELRFIPATRVGRSDLAIQETQWFFGPNRWAGANVTVRNLGPEPMGGWLIGALTTPDGKNLRVAEALPELGAGEVWSEVLRLVQLPARIPRGAYTGRVIIVPNDSTRELRLDNNESIRTFRQ